MDQPKTVGDYIARWRRLGAQLALVAAMLAQTDGLRTLEPLPTGYPPAIEHLDFDPDDLEDLEALLIAEMWELEDQYPGRN